MGFNRILQWLLPVLISLFLVTGCGDLEPEMQDTRTVILNMDFDQRSSSRTSRVDPAELINYKTHLIMVLTSEIMVLTSGKNLSNSNYWDYRSNQGEYVLYDSDREITLNMKLDTKMKIFAFLFRENYSIGGDPDYDLFSANRDAGYYGESQIITIDDRQSIPANIILNQVSGTDTAGGTDTGGGTDTTVTFSPANGATGVAISDNIIITFSEAVRNIDNTVLTDSNIDSLITLKLTNASGANITFDATIDANMKVITINPISNLPNSQAVYVAIGATVEDSADHVITAANATFTTGGSGDYGNTDTTAPVIETVTAVTTPTSDSTPDYTFSSTEAGSITYGGPCATSGSATTNAIVGHNLIIFNTLSDGSYINCTITVTDPAGNESTTLQIPDFTVQTISTLPAPDNLSASGANNTITLTWNSVSGASSYILYWDNVSGIDSSDNPINVFTNDNYTHSNMDNGSIYYYKVAAVDSSGTGTLSSVASAILDQDIQVSKTFNDHTYALTSTTRNWNNAKTTATAIGGHLTTINTKAENDWLTARFRIPYGELWIGANDITTSDTWVWDNGTTSGDSGLTDNLSDNAKWADNITSKWASGEPNHNGASCGHIWTLSGYWDDTPCNNNKYAIIEFD